MDAFGICIESKSRPLDRLRVRLGKHLGYLPRAVRLTWHGLARRGWLAGLAGALTAGHVGMAAAAAANAKSDLCGDRLISGKAGRN